MYSTNDGGTEVEVKFENETVWLNTHQMSKLFGVDRTSIVRHIHNIYKIGELTNNSTCAKIAQVAKDGKVLSVSFFAIFGKKSLFIQKRLIKKNWRSHISGYHFVGCHLRQQPKRHDYQTDTQFPWIILIPSLVFF